MIEDDFVRIRASKELVEKIEAFSKKEKVGFSEGARRLIELGADKTKILEDLADENERRIAERVRAARTVEESRKILRESYGKWIKE